MYPKPDRSDQTPHPAKTPDDESIDLGFCEGVLSDGRPYRAEVWAESQITMLTFFFSSIGLEHASDEVLTQLLVDEGLVEFLSDHRYVSGLKMRDAAGCEMWSVNVVVGDEDELYVNDLLSPGGARARPRTEAPRDTQAPVKLLYRIVPHNGGVVFARPERAVEIAKIHDAIASSSTWRDFESAMSAEHFSQLIAKSFVEIGEPRPEPGDPFSGECIPGWTDGDYPEWLQQEMDGVVPRTILEQFGRLESTSINGSFWFVPKECLSEICDAIRSLGWEVENAQELPFH